jgi:hypothetical protein
VQALGAVVAAVARTERGSIAERTRVGEPADGGDSPAQAADEGRPGPRRQGGHGGRALGPAPAVPKTTIVMRVAPDLGCGVGYYTAATSTGETLKVHATSGGAAGGRY